MKYVGKEEGRVNVAKNLTKNLTMLERRVAIAKDIGNVIVNVVV